MICKKCNAEIADDVKFCPSCGNAVSEEMSADTQAKKEKNENITALKGKLGVLFNEGKKILDPEDTEPKSEDALVIVDLFVVIASNIIGIGIFLLGIYFVFGLQLHLSLVCWATGIFFVAFSRAQRKGYVIDMQRGTFTFRCAWLSRSDGSGFVDSIKRYFAGHTVNLSDITSVTRERDIVYNTNSNGSVTSRLNAGTLKVVGKFGNTKLKFASQGKCDEVYEALRVGANLV